MNNFIYINENLNISTEEFMTEDGKLDLITLKTKITSEINNKLNITEDNLEPTTPNSNKAQQVPLVSKYIYQDLNQDIHYIISWENFELFRKYNIDMYIINNILNKTKEPIDLHIYPNIDYLDEYTYYQFTFYDILKYISLHPKVKNIVGHFCRLYHSYTDTNLILKYSDKIMVDGDFVNIKINLKKEHILLKDLYWNVYIKQIYKLADLGLVDKNAINKSIKEFSIVLAAPIKYNFNKE